MKYLLSFIAVVSFASFANAHDNELAGWHWIPDHWDYHQCEQEARHRLNNNNKDLHAHIMQEHCEQKNKG